MDHVASGTGRRDVHRQRQVPPGYSGLVTGDFNNDGRQDVAVLSGPTIDQFAFTGALLQGNGDGTFRPASYFTVPFYVGNLTSRRFQPRRQTRFGRCAELRSEVWAYLQTSASLSPLALNFSSQVIGTSGSLTVTLTNNGHNTLTRINVAISGLSASQFSAASMCGAGFAPGANCSITVTFTPTKGGVHQAQLSVRDTDLSPQTVPLQGQGVQ